MAASFTRLDPDAAQDRFLSLRRALGVESFGINLMVMEPGQRSRIHRHREQEEVYVVLAGELTLVLEDGDRLLRAGDAARVPAADRRQLVSSGADRLELLALGGSGEHVGRDGEAFSSWDDREPKSPRDVPLPS